MDEYLAYHNSDLTDGFKEILGTINEYKTLLETKLNELCDKKNKKTTDYRKLGFQKTYPVLGSRKNWHLLTESPLYMIFFQPQKSINESFTFVARVGNSENVIHKGPYHMVDAINEYKKTTSVAYIQVLYPDSLTTGQNELLSKFTTTLESLTYYEQGIQPKIQQFDNLGGYNSQFFRIGFPPKEGR